MSDTNFDRVLNESPFTDGVFLINPWDVTPVTGTWTLTRIAEGDYCLRKTAADNTATIIASLHPFWRTAAGKGVKVTSIDYWYKIATADLDAHTFVVDSVVAAHGVANAVAAFGGSWTGTPAVAQSTNMAVTTLTPGTAAFHVTAKKDVRIEITVNAAASSVYDFYGLFVNFTYNLA